MCLLFQLPLLDLIDANKKIGLINRRIRKSKGESQGNGLNKAEKFK